MAKARGICLDCLSPLYHWKGKRCKKCYSLWQIGRHVSSHTEFKKGIRNNIKGEFKKGHKPWNTGIERPEMIREKHWNWMGNNVGYHGLHQWVIKELGKAFWCYVCMSCEEGKMYQWANISKEYKRELTDWIPLCSKCHAKYDGVSEKMKEMWRNRKENYL